MTTPSAPSTVSADVVLRYLGLPEDYEPSPISSPFAFLSKHIRYLPPNHLNLFSSLITPRQRSAIPTIRNRRLRYTQSEPPELRVSNAKATWPTLWQGAFTADLGKETAKEEQDWADKEFLGGTAKQVGKLGALLGGFEEERGAELARDLRKQQRELEESLPEEDEDTDDEYEQNAVEELSPQEADALFARQIAERFISGLLDPIDYDKVDWDEQWEPELNRDEEERWFDEEEESLAID
ncbi:hypothetical protein BDW22DRAFT_495346 [Trametopsis cervina]|nr:hypothetical protein BDW22DRAFT_495346 [Trametopsis cervina]